LRQPKPVTLTNKEQAARSCKKERAACSLVHFGLERKFSIFRWTTATETIILIIIVMIPSPEEITDAQRFHNTLSQRQQPLPRIEWWLLHPPHAANFAAQRFGKGYFGCLDRNAGTFPLSNFLIDRRNYISDSSFE
jgi:hypothetical protein